MSSNLVNKTGVKSSLPKPWVALCCSLKFTPQCSTFSLVIFMRALVTSIISIKSIEYLAGHCQSLQGCNDIHNQPQHTKLHRTEIYSPWEAKAYGSKQLHLHRPSQWLLINTCIFCPWDCVHYIHALASHIFVSVWVLTPTPNPGTLSPKISD